MYGLILIFVIVDHNKRGTGYGKEMLKLALQYAFDITGVELVQFHDDFCGWVLSGGSMLCVAVLTHKSAPLQ